MWGLKLELSGEAELWGPREEGAGAAAVWCQTLLRGEQRKAVVTAARAGGFALAAAHTRPRRCEESGCGFGGC